MAPAIARVVRLKIRTRERRDLGEFCKAHDLVLIPVVVGKERTPVVLEGSCGGACTPTDLEAAKRDLSRIQAEVDTGRATESQLDYNFTDCLSFSLREKSRKRFGSRTIAILEGTEAGPHDVPIRFFQMATVFCGRVFVSKPFGATYGNRWNHRDLRISAELADTNSREVVVRVATAAVLRGTLFFEHLGQEEGQFQGLVGVESGIAVGVIAVREIGFGDRLGATHTLTNRSSFLRKPDVLISIVCLSG